MKYILIIENKWTAKAYVYPEFYKTEGAAEIAKKNIPQATRHNNIHIRAIRF